VEADGWIVSEVLDLRLMRDAPGTLVIEDRRPPFARCTI
jgi:hypothetical protein